MDSLMVGASHRDKFRLSLSQPVQKYFGFSDDNHVFLRSVFRLEIDTHTQQVGPEALFEIVKNSNNILFEPFFFNFFCFKSNQTFCSKTNGLRNQNQHFEIQKRVFSFVLCRS